MDRQELLLRELRTQNRILKLCLALGASLLLMAAASDRYGSFDEIDVQRFNVVTKDGKRELVIANRDRLPGLVIDGKERPDERQMAGLIFFNQDGDESGGLIWNGATKEKGGSSQSVHFSMDRFGGDQQLALGHYEVDGSMLTGLRVFDRGLEKDYGPLYDAMERLPDGAEKDALRKKWEDAGGRQTDRVFVGRTPGRSSAVILSDAKGRDRVVLYVEPDGKTVFNFLDENGTVLKSLAPN